MGMKKRFKKIASLVLSLAMAVTLLPTQYAYAEGGNTGADTPAVVSAGDATLPEPMIQFTFDNDVLTDTKGIAKATVGGGTAEAIDDDGRGDKVLNLKDNGYLKVTNKSDGKSPLAGKKAITISYWSKDSAGSDKAGWVYFIKKDSTKTEWTKQYYLGLADGGVIVSAERYWGNGNDGRKNGAVAATGCEAGNWKQVTVVLDTESTTIYINGEKKNTIAGQNATGDTAGAHKVEAYLTQDSTFEIGKADWESGQFYTGKLDDFTVYDGVLTAEQINALYLQDVTLQTLEVFAEGESAAFAKTKLTLPATVNNSAFTWTSGDTNKIDNDGTVKAWDGSEVVLTAKANISGNASWSRNFPVKLARKINVKYVLKNSDTPLKAAAEEYYKSSISSYPLKEEDKVWTDNQTKKTYVLSQTDSSLQIGDNATEVTLVYTEDVVESVITVIEPITLRAGMNPTLPETVKAKFSSGQERDVKVAWDEEAIKEACATPGKKTITGAVGTKSITVELNVEDKDKYLLAEYSFDEEDTENGWADSKGKDNATLDGTGKVATVPGLKGNAIELPGGGKGTAAIKLPDDLLKVSEDKSADDFTISMFIKNPGNGNSFAMSLLGDGTDNYIGFINRTGGNGNAVALECKKKDIAAGGCAANGQALADVWEHFAIVINGSEKTTKIYKNGVKLAEGKINFEPSELKQQRNYLGRAEHPDNDYKGIYDEFKVYSVALTDGEVQSLCDDVLYTEQMKKALAGLTNLKLWDGTEADLTNLTDDLKLPVKGDGDSVTVTWESTDNDVINVVTPGDGIVTQPYGEDAEDAEVTLTATVKVRDYEKTEKKTFTVHVPKREGVDKKPLRHAIAVAEQKYEAARQQSNIYVASSFDELKQALEDGKAALESTTVTDAEIAQIVSKLNKPLKLKNLDELSSLLAAWYPLDNNTDKAKDASGKGADGTVAGSVTFSREEGATFPGGDALTNSIKVTGAALDNLQVTDQLTISFWAKDARGDKSNAFGIGSGDAFGGNGCVSGNNKDAQFFYVNTHNGGKLSSGVCTKYWSEHTTIETTAPAQDEWHHITGVLSGKTLTLYIDGKKVGDTVETKATMTEIWANDPGTRGVYIGNCAYGTQPAAKADKDYKGSIRDVRIYNAALADAQVAEVFKYRETLPMAYAKDDVIAAMKELGAVANADGTFALDIIQTTVDEDGKLALPAKAYGEKATVTWMAEGDGKDAIDTTTNIVTIPAAGTVKKFTLKATIEVGGKTETLTYTCRAYTKNLSLDTSKLDEMITEMRAYKADDYTKASFAAFTVILNEVIDAEPLLNTAEEVTAQITKLQNAKNALVDISVLRAKIEALEEEFVALDETLYTTASCEAFKKKMKDAKAVLAKEDASKDEVDGEIAKLPAKAVDDLKTCGSKKPLEDAIADAEALATYKDAYANWETVEAALVTAKAELDKRLESYADAAEALTNVVNALVIKDDHKLTGTVKENLDKKLAAAKAENLTSSNYTAASWKNYKEALDKLEAVLGKEKATKDEAEAAAAALDTARAELVPVAAQKPGTADKEALDNAIASVITASSDYTAESWAEYQAAKDALTALSTRLQAEKNNVTKEEITKAIAALDAAAGKLVPAEGQALTEQDKAELEETITAAKELKLQNYTAESRKAFEDALANLEAISKKNNATKNELKAAMEAFEKAKAALVPTEEQTPTAEKKQEFQTAYENATQAASNMKPESYTEESWSRYQAALAAMKTISDRLAVENNNVTKDEIDGAIAELKAATEALVPVQVNKVDKTALDKAIKDCANLNSSAYTPESWNAFKAALDAAKAVLAKESATQDEVNKALAELNAKKAALKEAVKEAPKAVKVTKITLSADSKNIAAGKKVTVKASVQPSNATDKGLTWTTSNKKWATVNGKGVVTTKKAGKGKTVTITATAKDGSNKKGTIKIKIMKNAVTKISLKAKSKKVKAGKKVTIKASVKANDKNANKKLIWKTSNKKWATVNGKGVVTTKKAGKGKTVTITATSTDGTKKSAKIKIKITK